MSPDPLVLFVDAILFFLAPGSSLLLALFPGRRLASRHGWAYFTFIAVVSSAAMTILVGAALGFAPAEGGLFKGGATGLPILETTIGVATLALLWTARRRGAFATGLLPSKDAPAVIEVPSPDLKAGRLEDLQIERHRLRNPKRRPSTGPHPRDDVEGRAERLRAVEGAISSLESEPR
ncbi:MAG: hypothetical protein HY556_06390 [Euryarchaeota archaeon]|nr:hypothetical protein [Euryarchaeota archaeon]